jgi:hypothetical protein
MLSWMAHPPDRELGWSDQRAMRLNAARERHPVDDATQRSPVRVLMIGPGLW